MEIRRIWVSNYAYFRRIFEDDATANFVLDNLRKEAERQLLDESCPHIDLTLCAAYDDEGDALFDVQELKVLKDNTIIVNVEFACTAK